MRKQVFSIAVLLAVLLTIAGCGHPNGGKTNKSTEETISSSAPKVTESGTKEKSSTPEIEGIVTEPPTEEREETTTASKTTEPSETTAPPETSTPSETTSPQTEHVHKHSYSKATCTAPATCSCGATSGKALGHRYADATCTRAATCTVCGATNGTALGHQYASATCTKAATCTVCGATSGTALGHQYASATCTKAATCTVCGATTGSALGHNYSNGKCTRCGKDDPNYKPPVQEFDINYWVNYAKNYAKSVGLILNPDAVECWDNPTDADAKCIYLERDLSGRLNRYAKDKDITDVWIWYEDLGNGNYLIYIGYA